MILTQTHTKSNSFEKRLTLSPQREGEWARDFLPKSAFGGKKLFVEKTAENNGLHLTTIGIEQTVDKLINESSPCYGITLAGFDSTADIGKRENHITLVLV